MVARKTIEVWDVGDILQHHILNAKTDEARHVLCNALEAVLHLTNNYKGFSHFDGNGDWTSQEIWPGEVNYWRRYYYGNPRNTPSPLGRSHAENQQ